MAPRAKKKDAEITIQPVTQEAITFCLYGLSPLLMNRLSEKAKRELLLPSARKTTGDRKNTLKHNPVEEFRSSPHTSSDPNAPTLLQMPSTAFKGAMRSVAVDLPGSSSKAQLGRLTYVQGEYVPIWGVPQLKMDAVRSADMRKTPDIRTRACLYEWVAMVTVTYTTPILSEQMIVSLMGNAGVMQGVGDFRPEKGVGNFGTFEIRAFDDDDVQRVMASGDRAAQQAAMESPQPQLYDGETADLFKWFEEEVDRRGFKRVS